jgi:hypothetical protein
MFYDTDYRMILAPVPRGTFPFLMGKSPYATPGRLWNSIRALCYKTLFCEYYTCEQLTRLKITYLQHCALSYNLLKIGD